MNADELPEGWAVGCIPELIGAGGLFSDGDWVESKDQDPMGDVRLIQLADVGDGEYRDRSARFLTRTKAQELGCTYLHPGDVLVARMPDPLGRACVFPGDPKPCVTVVDVCILRPDPHAVDSRWLLHTLNSPQSRTAITGFEYGTTRKRISRSNLGRIVLPVPPITEQRRIVAAVEAVLAKVNAARDRLNRVPAILKRFRQAVLSAACSGRLTADWREQNPAIETAPALIARYRQTDKLRHLDTSRLPDIPETWAWLALPDTGDMNRGKSRHRPRNAPHLYGGPYPFIQTGDIANSGGRIQSHKQTYSEAGLEQSRLWAAGTVCITIAANIADSAILTYPACFPDSVVGVVTTSGLCDAEYLEYFLRTAREDLAAFAPATAQANINIAILNDLAVPVPPLAEQQEIVRRVGELFALADRIASRLTDARRMADQLTQAVLAKAFRGELVPTEAELARRENRPYEPAADLLARIRAGRQSAPANGKPGRKPRRT